MSQAQTILTLIDEIAGFGGAGYDFENSFIEGCDILGLGNNRASGSTKFWDVQASSGPWHRALFGSQINIKTYNARWVFGDYPLASSLPWEPGTLPLSFDVSKAENDVYRYLYSGGLSNIVFLKPASGHIEDMVKKATSYRDVNMLHSIYTNKKAWLASRLGKNFGIRVTIDESERRLKGVAILLSNGAVFARSEKPRGGRIAFKHDRKSHSSMGYKNVSIMIF